MSDFVFRPAERKRAPAKVALVGASGSGKTWGSLLLGRGLVGEEGMVAVVDTENGSASMYEGLIATKKQPKGFDVLNLLPPFSVERYLKAIKAAEEAGYDALIIDQISWMWDGPGGLLEMVDQLAKGKDGNFYAWKNVTPVYNDFVQSLLLSDLHIIATIRAKSVYGDEEDEKGKRKKVKIGTAPIQRPGLEYEFQIVFDLDQASNATVSKDRTGIFKNHKLPLGIEDGRKLREFLDSGRPMAPEEKRVLAGAALGTRAPTPTKAAPNSGNGGAQPSEPVLSLEQRKSIFQAAEKHGVALDRVAVLMREIGGTDKSDRFPVARLAALLERLEKEDKPKAEAEQPKGEPTLSSAHRKIIESTASNIGLNDDGLKGVLKEAAGADSLGAVLESKFTAVMQALLKDEEATQPLPQPVTP